MESWASPAIKSPRCLLPKAAPDSLPSPQRQSGPDPLSSAGTCPFVQVEAWNQADAWYFQSPALLIQPLPTLALCQVSRLPE